MPRSPFSLASGYRRITDNRYRKGRAQSRHRKLRQLPDNDSSRASIGTATRTIRVREITLSSVCHGYSTISL